MSSRNWNCCDTFFKEPLLYLTKVGWKLEKYISSWIYNLKCNKINPCLSLFFSNRICKRLQLMHTLRRPTWRSLQCETFSPLSSGTVPETPIPPVHTGQQPQVTRHVPTNTIPSVHPFCSLSFICRTEILMMIMMMLETKTNNTCVWAQ